MFWTKLKKVGKGCWASRLWLVGLCVVLSCSCLHGKGAIAAPQSSLQLGITALQQQQYDTALRHLDRAVQVPQGRDDAYSYRCFALLMQNQLESAVHSCTAAIQVNPEHAQAHFYQGLAQYRLGQFVAAIAAFDRHLQSHAEDPRAHYNIGLAKFARGDVSGAIAHYHQALTYAAPLSAIEMSNLYNDLGVAYWSHQRLDEAMFALDQAVERDADDPRAYFNRGCICHHLGEYRAALQDFDQVLALDPHYAETYLRRGQIKQQLGDAQAARQDYLTASEQFHQQGNVVGVQQAKRHLHHLQNPPAAVG